MPARRRRSSRSPASKATACPMNGFSKIEGYSGANLVRPGLERVRDLAAEGQIHAVLVYSPDRLSRKYAYQILLIEELARAGVEVVFVNAPRATTPEDQLLLQFQGMIAEYERAQILERSRRGKRHRAREGQISVLSGAPFGYRYVRKSDQTAAYYQVIEAEARDRAHGLRALHRAGSQHRCDRASAERAKDPDTQSRSLGALGGVGDVAQSCVQGNRLLRQDQGRDHASESRGRSACAAALPRAIAPATNDRAMSGSRSRCLPSSARRPSRLPRSGCKTTRSVRRAGPSNPASPRAWYPAPSAATRSIAHRRDRAHGRSTTIAAWARTRGGAPVARSATIVRSARIFSMRSCGTRSSGSSKIPGSSRRNSIAAWRRRVTPIRPSAVSMRCSAICIRTKNSLDRLVTAFQEELISLDELRQRSPALRQREHAIRGRTASDRRSGE